MILKSSLCASLFIILLSSAWGSDFKMLTYPSSSVEKAPFGSSWKLLVHSYFLENDIRPAPYYCTGKSSEEIFCCEKGKSVGMIDALAKSCGLFYEEKLSSVRAAEWKNFWVKRGISYSWIDKENLKAAHAVPVSELLSTLAKISRFSSFPELKKHLFEVVRSGTLKTEFAKIGSSLFIKTWTWNGSGGFAGWTHEGIPVWGMGIGTSAEVIRKNASLILQQIPVAKKTSENITVEFFKKYPVKSVRSLPQRQIISSGKLFGELEVEFKNGKKINISSDGKLHLSDRKIIGTFTEDEYVARVLEREGGAYEKEASRAFSVLIRTYLLKHLKNGVIADSSERQRVGPSAPSNDALAAAHITRGLVLKGSDVHYSDKSWAKAKQLAESGKSFTEILQIIVPGGVIALSTDTRNDECSREKLAESYLAHSRKRWEKTLMTMTGHENVHDIQVCRLKFSRPYSDLSSNRIYLHFDDSIEARLTLAHEYLHLSFKHHPLTKDEAFIENLAKKITGVTYE